MAQNPVLGKLQGQGLFETTTAGIEQAGGALAVTPVGAAMQGRGPDSQKMAGTQPAKINAAAANMRDVTSAALGTLRETSRVVEGQQDTIAAVAANADPLARADKAISDAAKSILNTTFASLQWEGANLDTTKLKQANFSDTDIADLSTSLAELIAGKPIKLADGTLSDGLTQSDINLLNRALKQTGGQEISLYDKDKPVSAYTLATSISSLYTKESTQKLSQIIADSIKNAESETQLSKLNLTTLNTILGTDYKDAEGSTTNLDKARAQLIAVVKSVTGLKESEIGQLNFRSLREAIDKWQKDEFKDVAALQATLRDPLASKARQKLALQELRRLGQIGVTGAEAKINDIQAQMADEDTVKIGNEEFTVEQLFSDPAKLLQLQTWVDNPETAPAELKTWLQQNQNGIQLQIQRLMGGSAGPGLFGAVAAIQGVADKLKTDPSIGGVDENVMKNLFPEFADLNLDSKIPVDPATLPADTSAAVRQKAQDAWDNYQKYALLQTPPAGQPNTALTASVLYNGLLTIPGVDGKTIFKELSVAQMKELVSSDGGVSRFLDGLKHRVRAANFKGDTKNMPALKGSFVDLAGELGFGPTGTQLANLFDADLTEYADIFAGAKLGDWLENGKFKVDKLQGLINNIKNMSTADLLAGKNRTIINDLSNLVTKLTVAAGEVPIKPEELTPELEAQFRKDNPTLHPDDLIAGLETKANQANNQVNTVRNNIQPYIDNWKQEEPMAIIGGTAPRRLAKGPTFGKGSGWTEWRQEMDRIEKPLRDAEQRRDTANNLLNDARNNRTGQQATYESEKNKWNQKRVTEIRTTNANTRKTYNNFTKLLGGIL